MAPTTPITFAQLQGNQTLPPPTDPQNNVVQVPPPSSDQPFFSNPTVKLTSAPRVESCGVTFEGDPKIEDCKFVWGDVVAVEVASSGTLVKDKLVFNVGSTVAANQAPSGSLWGQFSWTPHPLLSISLKGIGGAAFAGSMPVRTESGDHKAWSQEKAAYAIALAKYNERIEKNLPVGEKPSLREEPAYSEITSVDIPDPVPMMHVEGEVKAPFKFAYDHLTIETFLTGGIYNYFFQDGTAIHNYSVLLTHNLLIGKTGMIQLFHTGGLTNTQIEFSSGDKSEVLGWTSVFGVALTQDVLWAKNKF